MINWTVGGGINFPGVGGIRWTSRERESKDSLSPWLEETQGMRELLDEVGLTIGL